MSKPNSSVTEDSYPSDPVRSNELTRMALLIGVVILSLPFLMMSLMMIGMGWMAPPMQGGMPGQVPGFAPFIGILPLIIVIGVWYGAYKILIVNQART